jgi:hypothetical protein
MRTSILRIAFVIGALLVAAACDEPNKSPTAPTGVGAGPTATVTVTSLTISGNTSIRDIGGTTQLTATARYSDDTTQDVTALAAWRTGEWLSVSSPGLIRAVQYGQDTVYASMRGQDGRSVQATSTVRVAPDGVFLATVSVSEHGDTSHGARVQVASSAGTFSATTDLWWGYVCLPATGNAVLQVEKAGFRTITRSVTVTRDQDFVFVLEPSGGASSTVTR